VQAVQEFQQTDGNVVAALKVKTRLVNPKLVCVQAEPATRFSWPFQPSTVNLYSMVPGNKGKVTSQIESLLTSVIALQPPHQPLKLPFTFTVVNADPE
jgi:hypothetical protein